MKYGPSHILRGCRTLRFSALFVCLLFAYLCSKRNHTSHPNCVSKQGIETTPSVFLCGYKFRRFCEAVFPDYSCVDDGMSFAQATDILLVGMHAGCGYEAGFPGKVIFINGEPDHVPRPSRAYYLGPAIEGDRLSLQFYFVSIAALSIPSAYPSFVQRPRNTGRHFLLYTSRRCLPHREKAFNLFADVEPVTSAGRCEGLSVSVNRRHHDNFLKIDGSGAWTEASALYKDFKFGLVMENTKKAGYVSEKILNAFAGGTIPIYYGTEDVFSIFNAKAFVYFDEDNPAATVQQVRNLLEDENLYQQMLAQPILAPGAYDKVFALFGRGATKSLIRKTLDILDEPDHGDDR